MSKYGLSQAKLNAGRTCLDLLDKYGLGVQGAVWIYIDQLREWRFYIVTSLVDIDGLVDTYNRIEKLFSLQFTDPELTIDDVHLGSPAETIFMTISRAISVKGHSLIELENCVINNLVIEHAYIYRLDAAPPVIKAKQARQQFDMRLKEVARAASG